MAVDTTVLSTTIDDLLDKVPGLGYKITASIVTAGKTATTIAAELNKMGTNASPTRLRNWHFYCISSLFSCCCQD